MERRPHAEVPPVLAARELEAILPTRGVGRLREHGEHPIGHVRVVARGNSAPVAGTAMASAIPPTSKATVRSPWAADSSATMPKPSTSPGVSSTGNTCRSAAW
jgi:hypothetical protein